MRISFKNEIYYKMGVSKNEFLKWVQQIGRGFLVQGTELSSKIYSNYNVWEIGVIEATKSLVKKYKKKGITIDRKITDGKKRVIIEFPDEIKEEVLDQILPKHITFEELKARLIKNLRDRIKRIFHTNLLKQRYDLAYEMFEKHKNDKDDLTSRFTYWYYLNLHIHVENV